jgi:hypothetical protein
MYELGFYIPEDDILHSHFRENFKSYKGYAVPPNLPSTLMPPLARRLLSPDGIISIGEEDYGKGSKDGR